MADNQLLLNDNGGDGGVFVYTGGDQRVPRDVKRVRIAENIDTIPWRVFYQCIQLIEVEGHNRLRKIEDSAFYQCHSLRRVTKMTGVVEIEKNAFDSCWALSELEFDKLEIIGNGAFILCSSLRSINLPSIRRVYYGAFMHCAALTDAVFGEDLERIGGAALWDCTALRRISIPLKYELIIGNTSFSHCENLSNVDTLAGGIRKTISSLHMETWRNEIEGEIDRINRTLPNIQSPEKAGAILQWIRFVLLRTEHYRSEHQILLKEAMTLLELALWKAKLLNEADEKKCNFDVVAKETKIDADAARKEHRVTCGAGIVIKNVLPFLALK
jgi:hypothetical protein